MPRQLCIAAFLAGASLSGCKSSAGIDPSMRGLANVLANTHVLRAGISITRPV